MEKIKRITAVAVVLVLIMAAFCGNIRVVAATGQNVPYAGNRGDAATEEEGDIEVPFEPKKTLKSISIVTKPAKLIYLQGEALNLTGLVVKAYYSNNTNEVITNYQISGYSPNKLGTQMIRVSFGEKITSFKVTVVPLGDANGDAEIDGKDATLLLQYAAGWEVALSSISADANGDGEIDGKDATLLLQYVAGWDVTLGK